MNFNVSDVTVVQRVSGRSSHRIEVLTHERLQQEERTRQVAAAILVGVAAGANAAAAANAGYYNSRTTFVTPRGNVYTAHTTGYSPGLAMAAQVNAAAQNAQMIDAAVAQGQANLARLENEYIKDHTLLPGEWYGGLVGIEPPLDDERQPTKTYTISVRVGSDVHSFEVVQEPNRQ